MTVVDILEAKVQLRLHDAAFLGQLKIWIWWDTVIQPFQKNKSKRQKGFSSFGIW